MTPKTSPLTGREPRLSNRYSRKGTSWQLSPRKLATMFNLLSPQTISLPAAAAALHHKSYFVRYNAAQALSRRADREARLIMQEVLDDGEVRSRASVARFLHGFSWFTGQPLFKQAVADPDNRVREAAIYALCDLRSSEAFELMVDILADEVDNVRAAAAWGLRDCQNPASVPVLEVVLKAKDPEVRVKALEVLGANGIPEAIPIVRNAIADPHPDVKYAATLSLLELQEENALAELAGVIQQTEGPARQPILKGFFHATNYLHLDLGQSKAADLVISGLAAAIQDNLPETRMAAAWPLAWMRHDQAEAILKQAYYQEKNEQVKGHFVYTAVNLLCPIGKELIQDALANQSGHVYQIAKDIMQNIDL